MDQAVVIRMTQEEIDNLGYDLGAEAAIFRQALDDHKNTEGVPAPTSYPLVERIVREGVIIEIIPPPVVPEPPLPTTVSMSTFWSRMTEQEAEAVDGAIAGATVRLRRVFNALTALPNDHPDYAAIRNLVITAVASETRAGEILAPEF